MTVVPYGMPRLTGAWLGLVTYLAGDPVAQSGFTNDTGLSIGWLADRDAISRMIDTATGRDKQLLIAWCDWVTKNHWGVEGDE